MNKRFSSWSKWNNRQKLHGIKKPGVYAIAISTPDIKGKKFSWKSPIVYIGMTNSKGGLRSRLRQFDNTIKGKRGHSGAKRVRHNNKNYHTLAKKLFVSICPFNCNLRLTNPSDLLIMGAVAKHEYTCLARFVKAHKRLPEFNYKIRSPKN
jgi:hypothetical protein